MAVPADTGTRRRRAIEVADYDPAWPGLFREIALELHGILGTLVLEIDHIGSTAVPGLCAKPKIDIDVVLRGTSLIAEGIARLQATGAYIFHGDRYQDGMWVFTTGRGSRGRRVYLCGPGTPTHVRRLLFRDQLRCDPQAAARYGALKRQLASETADDWDYYTGGKAALVTEIVRQACRARIRPAATRGAGTAGRAMLECRAPDGARLGCVVLEPASQRLARLVFIGVRRAWRCGGIGAALVDAAAAWAGTQGCSALVPGAVPGPLWPAQAGVLRAFWRATGFVAIDESHGLRLGENPVAICRKVP